MLVNDAKDLLVEPTHGHASQEIVLVIIFKLDTIHHGGDLVQDQRVVAAEQYLQSWIFTSNVTQQPDGLDGNLAVYVQDASELIGSSENSLQSVSIVELGLCAHIINGAARLTFQEIFRGSQGSPDGITGSVVNCATHSKVGNTGLQSNAVFHHGPEIHGT